ncbi:transposase domain-containing protein, partial [Pseudomonas sp. NPDC089743]|uniref:transposase domain-containing protein n=1 Tax=Pseudomonas sp. NPDC089743 TaxID=3364471 RepID=UPI003814F6D3
AHHAGLAPEGNREHSIGHQVSALNVGFMEHLRLFSDTPKGATASAQLYSLVETAKANGQEPYAWLRHALERLPQACVVEDYEALLPWNCTPKIHS